MNVHENPEIGLKEKVIKKIGEHFVKAAETSLSCRLSAWYEPELTSEMIIEMMDKHNSD